MSGQGAPRLPPGISVQKSVSAPPPRLPPGISMARSSDSSPRQVQRTGDSNGSNMDRLAGLGIQVSRTVEQPSPDLDRLQKLGISVQQSSNSGSDVQSRLSGLGVSVSGGPQSQARPKLPPGVSISGGGPSPRPNLPPGISVSGGPSPVKSNGGQPPPSPKPPAANLPPGVSISGVRPIANGGQPPRPVHPNGQPPRPVNINGQPPRALGPRPQVQRPSLPPGVSVSSGPRPSALSPQPHKPPAPAAVKEQQVVTPPSKPDAIEAPAPPQSDPRAGASADKDRSQSPAETMSDINNFVNETQAETSQDKGEQGETDATQKPDSIPEAIVDEETGTAEEESQDDSEKMDVDDTEGGEKIEGAKVEEDKDQPAEESEAKSTNDEEKESNDEAAENPTSSKEPETNVDPDPEKETSSTNGETTEGNSEAPAETAAEGAEGEENWDGYEEGYEGYEGEEGWEGYEEGEEGWEGYEGEEGWEEGYEEGAEGEEGSKGKAEEKAEDEKDKSSDEHKGAEETPASEDAPDASGGDAKESQEEQTNDGSMDCDDDGAPKQSSEENREQEEPSTPVKENKLPPGVTMSPVPNNVANLPPGISISSPAPTNLPPGISISPFKKPSVSSSRQSMDDDNRSQMSQDSDSNLNDSVSVRSFRDNADPDPSVGTETCCVFCLEKCSGLQPKLLTCLHSACASCFAKKIRESMRNSSSQDVVDLDGNEVQMDPEVVCPVCKATTSEDEAMDNVFAVADPSEDDAGDEDGQNICYSCEEGAMASSKCEDCEELLCSDCVRAHQRVKVTKDHKISQLSVSVSAGHSLAHLNYCKVHRNEKLTLYCETCDTLNCRDCQLSELHRHHKYRYSYEVAPEVKGHLMQSVSDIRLKKSGLEESRQVLSSKISTINAKENALMDQIREIKSYLIAKIENRHKELVTEISKICREKRKILEGRKSTLDRTFWQAEYATNFVEHLLGSSISDEKILLTKKMIYRQMKRMRRANNAVGLTPQEMELKLDLYFQHFTSQSLHNNLDNVLKMVMNDIKVSQVPIEAPKPKPPPQPAPQPSPVRQPPGTPTRALPGSPGGAVRGSPGRINAGMVSRQLATPTKQVQVRGSPMRGSPLRGGLASPVRGGLPQRGGRVMVGGQQRVQPMRGGGRGGQVMMAGGRGGQVRTLGQPMGGRGQVMMGGRGRAQPMRGQVVMGQQRGMVGQQRITPTKTRGGVMAAMGRGGGMVRPVMRGGMVQQQARSGVQIIRGGGVAMQTRPRMAQQQVSMQPARRGRPPAVMQPQNRTIYQNQPRHIAPQPQRQPQRRSASPTGSMVSAVSSWHTPSINRPVSPPKTNESFKIKLPKMGAKTETVDLDDDIISIDPPSPQSMAVKRPGLQISRGPSSTQEEGVDPLSLDDMPRAIKMEKPANTAQNNSSNNAIAAPDFSSLIDDDISTAGDWLNNGSSKSGKPAMSVVSSMTTLKTEAGQANVKQEAAPVMEGSAKSKAGKEGEWCAVCHDGGDTLYCCDRCPLVYHMFCYIPPLTSEPPDDWICLMCSTTSEILSVGLYSR